MKNYLKLIRVKQWIKNVLVLAPIICAGQFGLDDIGKCLIALFGFSFTASFIYIVNDIRDIEKDKLHPRKSKRPLPSGKISIRSAIIVAIIMLILSIILTISTHMYGALIILVAYIIINILYSFGLKDVPIIDVAILSAGFVLRVYYGALIFNIDVSNWLFLTIMCGSLFLGLGKRKKEIVTCKDARKVLSKYTESFLDRYQYLSLALMLVFYSLWTMEQDKLVVFSIPLLILLFMRYSLVTEKTNEGDPTTVLYQDIPLLVICVLYTIVMLVFFVVM